MAGHQRKVSTDRESAMNSFVRFQYPKEYGCAQLIKAKIEKKLNIQIDEDECTYLTIHIARLMK